MVYENIPPAPELTGRQKLWLVGLVILKRVRFIAILAGVGLLIVRWEDLKSHWDRWTHSHVTINRELPPGQEFFCSMDPQVVRSTYEPNGDVPGCPICGMPLESATRPRRKICPPASRPACGFRPSACKWRVSRPWRSTIVPCRGRPRRSAT